MTQYLKINKNNSKLDFWLSLHYKYISTCLLLQPLHLQFCCCYSDLTCTVRYLRTAIVQRFSRESTQPVFCVNFQNKKKNMPIHFSIPRTYSFFPSRHQLYIVPVNKNHTFDCDRSVILQRISITRYTVTFSSINIKHITYLLYNNLQICIHNIIGKLSLN